MAPFDSSVFSAVVWEAFDRGFDGGFVQSGKLSGLILGRFAPWFNRVTNNFNAQFVKQREDGYMINVILLQGVVIPAAFLACYLYTAANGFSLALCWAYHVFRIGPYFMNFAYCYTLCHKEGHSLRGLYSKPYNNAVLRNIFNWWVGLFFGVMPASFAFGHSINHHRYNNGPLDVVTTADKPRDSFVNWICYLPRWTSYSLNLSSIVQFTIEGNYKVAKQMVWGSVYFWLWFGFWANLDSTFATAYLLYPFLENVVLLACVNWSWHAFNNPNDPEDEYVRTAPARALTSRLPAYPLTRFLTCIIFFFCQVRGLGHHPGRTDQCSERRFPRGPPPISWRALDQTRAAGGQALGTVHRAPRDVLSRDARLRDLRHGGGARLRHASEEVRRPQRREDWKADDAPGDGEAAPVSRPRVLVGPPRAEGSEARGKE